MKSLANIDDMTEEERWEAGTWEGNEKFHLRYVRSWTTAQKLEWLEDARELVNLIQKAKNEAQYNKRQTSDSHR